MWEQMQAATRDAILGRTANKGRAADAATNTGTNGKPTGK